MNILRDTVISIIRNKLCSRDVAGLSMSQFAITGSLSHGVNVVGGLTRSFKQTRQRNSIWHEVLDCYNNIMSAMGSQLTSVLFVWLTIKFIGVQENKALCDWPLCGELHRWAVNSPQKGQITWKMFPFDGVIMFIHPTSKCRLQCWLG